MRNFWVAIIGVLMIASFAGTSFAAAPVVQDIPDFRLLTMGSVNDFDLDNYVADPDAGAANLLWTIESQTGFLDAGPAVLGATPNDNLLDILSRSDVQEGVVTLRATDVINVSDEYAEDTSAVKFSTVMLVGPGLTEDYNLRPANDDIPRTLVIQGDATTVVSGISSLLSPAGTVDYSVSIADLDGQLMAGDNTSTATYGDLSASIATDGTLSLSAPASAYPITGAYQLSGAYRVGVKATVTGGLGEENWDGMELLVANGRFPTNIDQNTPELLQKFSGFEGVPTGDLPTSVVAMRALASADNSRWFTIQKVGAATAKIVNTGIPTSTWATSGTQALEVSVAAEGDLAFIESEHFTDIQPGEVITFAANVTTTGSDVTTIPDVYMWMGSHLIASNYEGVLFQKATNTDPNAVQVPYNNAWRTLKVTFTADELGAALADGANPDVNVYQLGYRAFIVVRGHGASKAYFDNIRVYRDKADIDKALGATVIDPVLYVSGAPTTTHFDGTFEAATDPTTLGWYENPAAGQNDGTLAVNQLEAYNLVPADVGSNSLEVYLPGAENRTARMVEYVMCDVQTDASPVGGVDFSGDGIYAMTVWYKTSAQTPKNTPGIMFGMAGLRFLNVPFSDCGYAGAPLASGAWKKITISSARYDYGKKLKVFAIVRADDPAALPTRDYWGSYQNDERFGMDADGHVFIDDLQIHKVMDQAMYFDRSVFPTN